LRPSVKTNAEFLFAIVRTDDFAEYLARRAKGANYPAVNASDIKEFEVPLAPLALQTRFAEFVRQADKSKFVAQRATQTLDIRGIFSICCKQTLGGAENVL
jgi:type I restriction enzyme S subunit